MNVRYSLGPFQDWKNAAGIAWAMVKQGIPFVYTPDPPTLHINPTDKQAEKLMDEHG